MFKLVKYELMGRYKFNLIMLISLAILNLTLTMNIFPLFGMPVEVDGNINSILFSLLTWTVAVIFLIRGVRLFSADLYSDSGYLTFTLPKRSSSVLGAKLLTLIIEGIPFVLVIGIFAFVTTKFQNPIMFDKAIHFIEDRMSLGPLVILTGAAYYISFMLLIYLSLAISRSILANKKNGKLFAFLIFILLNIIISYIKFIIAQVTQIPLDCNFSGLSVLLILYTILSVTLFIATQYLMEKKINL